MSWRWSRLLSIQLWLLDDWANIEDDYDDDDDILDDDADMIFHSDHSRNTLDAVGQVETG